MLDANTMRAETAINEASTLRDLLATSKDQLRKEKETNNEIIESLRYQIEEHKRSFLDQKKKHEFEIQRMIKESDRDKQMYKHTMKAEEEKLRNEVDHLNRKVETEQHLSKELTILNDKLQKDQVGIRNQYETEGYSRGDNVNPGVRQADFLTQHGIPIVQNVGNADLSAQYMERQKTWNDLESETRDLKREIGKVGLIPIPERVHMPIQYLEDQERDNYEFKLDDAAPHREDHRFDQFEPLEEDKHDLRGSGRSPGKEPSPSKPKKRPVDKVEIERVERERAAEKEEKKRKADREKAAKLEREKEAEKAREEKKKRDRERREKADKDRKKAEEEAQRKKKAEEDEKRAKQDLNKPISTSVKNPFAKMGGGGKKPDPIGGADFMIGTQPENQQLPGNQPKPFKKPSDEIDDPAFEDDYENLGFQDIGEKRKSSDEIQEEISGDNYSGFEESDPNEEPWHF